jgi:hypothetical protein
MDELKFLGTNELDRLEKEKEVTEDLFPSQPWHNIGYSRKWKAPMQSYIGHRDLLPLMKNQDVYVMPLFAKCLSKEAYGNGCPSVLIKGLGGNKQDFQNKFFL